MHLYNIYSNHSFSHLFVRPFIHSFAVYLFNHAFIDFFLSLQSDLKNKKLVGPDAIKTWNLSADEPRTKKISSELMKKSFSLDTTEHHNNFKY